MRNINAFIVSIITIISTNLITSQAFALSQAQAERYLWGICVAESLVLSVSPINTPFTAAARSEVANIAFNIWFQKEKEITGCDVIGESISQIAIATGLVDSTQELTERAQNKFVDESYSRFCGSGEWRNERFCQTKKFRDLNVLNIKRRESVKLADLPSEVFTVTSPDRPQIENMPTEKPDRYAKAQSSKWGSLSIGAKNVGTCILGSNNDVCLAVVCEGSRYFLGLYSSSGVAEPKSDLQFDVDATSYQATIPMRGLKSEALSYRSRSVEPILHSPIEALRTGKAARIATTSGAEFFFSLNGSSQAIQNLRAACARPVIAQPAPKVVRPPTLFGDWFGYPHPDYKTSALGRDKFIQFAFLRDGRVAMKTAHPVFYKQFPPNNGQVRWGKYTVGDGSISMTFKGRDALSRPDIVRYRYGFNSQGQLQMNGIAFDKRN